MDSRKDNSIKSSKLGRILLFTLGFSSTAPILAIPFMGVNISLYSITLFFVVVFLVFSSPSPIRYGYLVSKYYIWSILGVFSSLFGLLFFMGNVEWETASVEFIPKLFLYMFLLFLLNRASNRIDFCKCIAYGLMIGFIFNIGWAIVDAIGFYVTGNSITNEIFAGYIEETNKRFGMISLTVGGTIRSCGLNVDPANIGLFSPIVALYGLKKKQLWLYVMAALGILASLSHTAFLGVLIITLIYLYQKRKESTSLLMIVFFVIVSLFILTYSSISSINQMQEAFVDRTEEKADGSEMNSARGEYWLNFFPAAISQPSSLIIGTGYGTASYPYLKSKYVHHGFYPYDPEQTYFSMFFDIGLVGVILYLLILFGIYKKTKTYSEMKNSSEYTILFSCIIGSSIASLGYHYTVYSVIMLILITGTILCDSTKILNIK